jgi:hypothetical protein
LKDSAAAASFIIKIFNIRNVASMASSIYLEAWKLVGFYGLHCSSVFTTFLLY